MKKYDVLDVFSYASKDIIDISELVDIFQCGIDNPEKNIDNFYVKQYGKKDELDEYISMVVSELENEGKRIAFICDNNRIIAVIGYREI